MITLQRSPCPAATAQPLPEGKLKRPIAVGGTGPHMARLSHLSYMFGRYGALTPAGTSQFCEMVASALAEARRLPA